MQKEANRLELCDFYVEKNGEQWHIDKSWIQASGDVAWYEGLIFREGVAFRRLFCPSEFKTDDVFS